MLSLRARLRLLSRWSVHFPDLGSISEKSLKHWVIEELGSLTVLEYFEKRGEHFVRALAPDRILIIGAGNLGISLAQSMRVGLVLGSDLIVKPGAGTENYSRKMIAKLPIVLRKKVTLVSQVSPADYKKCDAVIALGSDETLQSIRQNLHPKQRWIGYGHRVSGIWIEKSPSLKINYDQIADDISKYDQQGCLSPRWIALSPQVNLSRFSVELGKAMDRWIHHHSSEIQKNPLTPSQKAMIYELRQCHRAYGDSILESHQSCHWTLIHNPTEVDWKIVLPRTIYLFQGRHSEIENRLHPFKGHLSTVACFPSISKKMQDFWMSWGASRFCCIGKMQVPPLNWLHDGRPQMSDLVHWVQCENLKKSIF